MNECNGCRASAFMTSVIDSRGSRNLFLARCCHESMEERGALAVLKHVLVCFLSPFPSSFHHPIGSIICFLSVPHYIEVSYPSIVGKTHHHRIISPLLSHSKHKMYYTLLLAALTTLVNASPMAHPQAVTERISASGTAPSGCVSTAVESFGILALKMESYEVIPK